MVYQPDQDHLSALLEQCLDQCEGVVLINNGGYLALSPPMMIGVHVIDTGGNIGLAAAQNLGVKWAAVNAFTFLWFIDQDSLPGIGLVATLRREYLRLESIGASPAAVGPGLIDNRDGVTTPFVRFHYWGVERLFPEDHKAPIECDFLISSGLFTTLSRFLSIGYWEEGLFIDNVDLEWSFRARSLGFHCYGVGAARLEHSLGDRVIRLNILGRSLTIHFHVPFRQYYITRNRIFLYKRDYVPVPWKAQDIPRALLKSIVLPLISPSRWCNIKFIIHGARDGFRGRVTATNEFNPSTVVTSVKQETSLFSNGSQT